ncbi:serine hydrolase domain-containing protein [Halolamina sediminis]|jgi:CubicO group peptidase (beta-lactamase class C family)|uniref:serine hydrolase domain-containing protein n=1 Tax=Halolamina sediminis TaxID=1480675 RepID=UPI0006B52D9E|nr:serine hydrolase domain-containing protein [Halolamina sediminis]
MRQALSRRRFLAGVGASCAAAAVGPRTATASPSPAQSEIEATLDDLVAASLDEHDVPGATVAVVDGDSTLTKGYGVADREQGGEIDPAETAFRLGSVSKSVTATALMDAIQRGEIDPDEPVSEYVDGPLAPERPVTLAELITHRGGFEASNRGMWYPDVGSLRPLATLLETEPQKQVREPGTVGAYSNFGYALAGQVLASTAGEPFHRAIDDALLGPTGMSGSSFEQPLPDSLAGSHATGHGGTGPYRDGEFPLVGLRPAGSLSATADDVARFLELHLNGGAVGGEQVLEPGTIDAMHDQWATHHEQLAGMGFGLFEEFHGDVRTLWHNGATLSFYSHLVLVPEYDFGLFVGLNAANGSAAADVVDGVLEELLPDTEPRSLSPDGQPTRADELTGTYRALQQSHTWHDRTTSVLNAPTLRVRVADDGALVTERGDSTNRWVEIEPLVFQHESDGRRIAFGEDGGTIQYLFTGGSPTAFGRVEGVDRLQLHGILALLTMFGALSSVGGWPAGALYRRLRAERAGEVGDVSWETLLGSRMNRAKLVAAGGFLATLGGLALVIVHLGVTPYRVLSDPPVTFRALFAGPMLGLAGAVGSLGYAGRLWLAGDGSRLARIHYTLVAASLAGLCWLLRYWNLLAPPP